MIPAAAQKHGNVVEVGGVVRVRSGANVEVDGRDVTLPSTAPEAIWLSA